MPRICGLLLVASLLSSPTAAETAGDAQRAARLFAAAIESELIQVERVVTRHVLDVRRQARRLTEHDLYRILEDDSALVALLWVDRHAQLRAARLTYPIASTQVFAPHASWNRTCTNSGARYEDPHHKTDGILALCVPFLTSDHSGAGAMLGLIDLNATLEALGGPAGRHSFEVKTRDTTILGESNARRAAAGSVGSAAIERYDTFVHAWPSSPASHADDEGDGVRSSRR